MNYNRMKERTSGLDLGIQRAVKDAWDTNVKMIYERGYEDGYYAREKDSNTEEKLKEIIEYFKSRVPKSFEKETVDEIYDEMRNMVLGDIAEEISRYIDIIVDLKKLLEV